MSEKTNLRGIVVVEFDKKEEKGGRRGRKGIRRRRRRGRRKMG